MRILGIVAALGLSASALFAMTAPSGYLEALKNYLNNKTFTINGKFYMYDFNHDSTIARNDWLYIDTASGAAYRLMGKTPTATDAFGWLPLDTLPADLNINKPSGYFIFINFPKDQELYGTNAFSWLYVVNNQTFKLMGALPNHNFDYLDIDGDGYADVLPDVTYTISNNQITFNISSTSTTPPNSGGTQQIRCQDEKSYNYGTYSAVMKQDSWYQGAITYNCKFDAPYSWGVTKDAITITQIIKTQRLDLKFNENRATGTITYDYKAGSVHNRGTYNGKSFDCYEYYKPPVPATISQNEHQKLEELMEWTGEGPCDPDLIKTTCPDWFYNDLQACDATGQEKPSPVEEARNLEADIKTNWTVQDSDGQTHKIYRHEYYKYQR